MTIVLSTARDSRPAVEVLALETMPTAPGDRPVTASGDRPVTAREPVRVAQAPPRPAPPAAPSGRLISLDFKDADVVNLLRILAAESGKNIVISDDVKGKMSITLKNVPWEQALDIIMEARGLEKVERGNVIRIVTREQLGREREAAAKLEESRAKAEEAKAKADVEIRTKAAEASVKEQEAQQRKLALEQQIEEIRARGPIREETIRLAYADPEDVAKTLLGLLGIQEGTPLQTIPPPTALPPGASATPAIGTTVLAERAPGTPQTPSPDALAKGITIRAHKPTNSIFIRHYEKDIERIKKIIRETLDVQLPLVKIEARLNELRRTDLFEVGVQWGGAGARRDDERVLVAQGIATQPLGAPGVSPPIVPFGAPATAARVPLTGLLPISALTGLPLGGNLVNLPTAGAPTGAINFGIIGSRFNLNLALQALESEGKTRSLSKPEIVTTDNAKAIITLGTEIPYQTGSVNTGFSVVFRDAALKLEVTPTVIREPDVTKVKMKLIIEDNSPGNVVAGLPQINKRSAQTEVVVREGETLVIGGVTQRTETESVRKVPMFGDVPIFGWLFKARRRAVDPDAELIVFITPTVLRDAPQGTRPTAPTR
ncbi:MAG: secretin and TonB N-terminal domain-containing protein [Candidatus Rokubacteria bacterium]|nr:secretin and TonB N-terminal domain-containing protein [Candidatus Rokubacteria bacterium]